MLIERTNVEIKDRGLIINNNGHEVYFNYYWLRDNCPTSFDATVRERTFDITSIAKAPKVASAQIEDGHLIIDWQNEDHQTRFALDWLLDFQLRGGREDPAALKRKLWRAGYCEQFPRFSRYDVINDMSTRAAWAHALIEQGIAVITNMADSDSSLTDLANCLGLVRPSVAGEYFDVKVHIDPVNLAFTANALEMHTDTPSEEMAPGMQFLHCRQNSVEGGYSLFLDGAAVAEDFRHEHPEEFELLCNHKIPFFYEHDEFDWRAHQHVIELDSSGSVSGVSISQHMADIFDLPQEVLDYYYPAFTKFLRKINDPIYINRFRMNAGECLVFDNHRIVHGREAYCATSGQRHLRGCYIDRGEMRSTYRTLYRKGFV